MVITTHTVQAVKFHQCRATSTPHTLKLCSLPNAECESNDFTCDDGECVRARRFCDGEQDCDDGSDERPGCTPIATTDPPSTLSSGNASAGNYLFATHCTPQNQLA